MSEFILPHEQRRFRNSRRAIALLTAAALTGCASPKPAESQAPPAAPRGGNFPLHHKGYEKPTVLNCQTGPREQHLEFEGTAPKAYVFELHDQANQLVQAVRLKVFGPGSDLAVTKWDDPKKETDHSYPVPTPDKPAVIPFEPGAVITVRPVSQKPFKADIDLDCQ
jgi:hypothetical protein